MTWTPSTPSLPPGSGRPTPTSARSTGSSPPPTPESSSATYTQTLRGDGLLGSAAAGEPPDEPEPRPVPGVRPGHRHHQLRRRAPVRRAGLLEPLHRPECLGAQGPPQCGVAGVLTIVEELVTGAVLREDLHALGMGEELVGQVRPQRRLGDDEPSRSPPGER